MKIPVIDLHCDLLLYLSLDPNRTPYDPAPRCSFTQLDKGNVKMQVLAIFAETKEGSEEEGAKQIAIFRKFKREGLRCAIENASAFCSEEEPLQNLFARLDRIDPVYLSLTWNFENRFGGGSGCEKPIKEDGKRVLDYLDSRNIAIDFSHTSDALADSILNYIDQKGLKLPVLASHSNYRAICNHERNLPDAIAKEIIRRKGVIGLVFYGKFLKTPDELFSHIDHALKLGGEDAIAFGADFFSLDDLPVLDGLFHEEMANSSCYPAVLQKLQAHGYPLPLIEKIAHKNAERFMKIRH